MAKSIADQAVDNYLWKVTHYLSQRHGLTIAWSMLYPLEWYVRTGRASSRFLHMLLDTKPYVIGRILANEDGSIEDIVNQICDRIGFDRI